MESVMFSIHLLLGLLIAAGIMYVVFPPHFKAITRRKVTEWRRPKLGWIVRLALNSSRSGAYPSERW